MNPYNFNKFYRIFDNLNKLLDNDHIQNIVKELNEGFVFNGEELLLINAIYEFNINKNNINNLIVFTNLIPNFY